MLSDNPRRLLAILGGAVFAVSFLFRFMVQPGVSNDFVMHVVGGRQMLLGDWPVLDVVDPGLPLMHAMSALAEWLGGQSRLSKVTVSLIFWRSVSARLRAGGRSVPLARGWPASKHWFPVAFVPVFLLSLAFPFASNDAVQRIGVR